MSFDWREAFEVMRVEHSTLEVCEANENTSNTKCKLSEYQSTPRILAVQAMDFEA